jgi:hypothetical protein
MLKGELSKEEYLAYLFQKLGIFDAIEKHTIQHPALNRVDDVLADSEVIANASTIREDPDNVLADTVLKVREDPVIVLADSAVIANALTIREDPDIVLADSVLTVSVEPIRVEY